MTVRARRLSDAGLQAPKGFDANPAVFNTAVADWKPGDEFLAGSDLGKFRIVAINTEDPPEEFNGVFVVEAVER